MMKTKIMRQAALRRLTITAFLVAVEIVLARFCSINTPIVRIGLSFLPISLLAMLYGPLTCAVGYAAADFIGAIVFPTGAYFAGFTATAFAAGLIYGFFLYKRRVNWLCAAGAAVCVCLTQLFLDTFWLSIITGKGMLALLPVRVFKSLVMIPVITAGVTVLSARLARLVNHSASLS